MSSPLSLTGKRWVLPSADDAAADIGSLLERLRVQRGIATAQDARSEAGGVYDPSVYPDARKAAERLRKAVTDRENIALFGDYDCDGVTGTAIVARALQRHGTEPLLILPQRAQHGYGLKPWVIDRCRQEKITLLVTIDNGVSAPETVALGNEAGIDTIIIDHHHVPAIPPEAYAIVHPALAPDHPLPHPSAAGVAFRFLHAFDGNSWDGRDYDLSLATIGTIADLVPLKGWNRQLVQDGLAVMQRGIAGPLGQMIASVRKDGSPLTSGDIAFRIAPRINAAGRMTDPMLALRAVLDGGQHLQALDTLNARRQQETLRCLTSLDAQMSATTAPPPMLCIADTDFPPGIIGLIAGKLTEKYGRPSIVASIRGNECTASLRSIPGYHVTEALERHSSMLTTYGGHAQAAGCTFTLEAWDALRTALCNDVDTRVQPELLLPSLTLDAVVDPRVITNEFCRAVSALEPYGQANPEPLFMVRMPGGMQARTVGSDNKHLQATAGSMKMIGFGLGHLAPHTISPVELACTIGSDTWNGVTRPQLTIKDMRAAA